MKVFNLITNEVTVEDERKTKYEIFYIQKLTENILILRDEKNISLIYDN